MFGIGFIELAVVALCAIIFVGPKKLPEMMKQFGKFFVHARRMTSDVRQTFDQVVRDAEHEIHQDELKKIRELTSIDLNKAKQDLLESTGLTDHGPAHHDDYGEHHHDEEHLKNSDPSFDQQHQPTEESQQKNTTPEANNQQAPQGKPSSEEAK